LAIVANLLRFLDGRIDRYPRRHSKRVISERSPLLSTMGVLSPEAVLETVHLVALTGIIAVRGYAENVPKPWFSKSARLSIFGDLGLVTEPFPLKIGRATLEVGDRAVIGRHLRPQRVFQNNNEGAIHKSQPVGAVSMGRRRAPERIQWQAGSAVTAEVLLASSRSAVARPRYAWPGRYERDVGISPRSGFHRACAARR
jgi:hypothetical protein